MSDVVSLNDRARFCNADDPQALEHSSLLCSESRALARAVAQKHDGCTIAHGHVALPKSKTLFSKAPCFIALTKPKICALALVATLTGFCVAQPFTDWTVLALLLHTLWGTALTAAGANALNQYLEADLDRLMERTRNRPIPSGRLSRKEALCFGLLTSAGGAVYLAVLVNTLASALALMSLISYVCLYTPLKRVTSLCVFVGAVPGALPPVIGWAAGANQLSIEAWLLFGILFFWQLPHFAAISWMYRQDYSRAGYPLLSTLDPTGLRVNLHMVTHTIALLVTTLIPVTSGMAGPVYAGGAMVLGVVFLGFGVAFVVRQSQVIAQCHVLASITYLPALLVSMVIDKALF